jgi:hypothetical protein
LLFGSSCCEELLLPQNRLRDRGIAEKQRVRGRAMRTIDGRDCLSYGDGPGEIMLLDQADGEERSLALG